MRGECALVQADLELALAAALDLDLRDAGDADQLRLQRVLCQVPEVGLRAREVQRVAQDREDGGVHPLDVHASLGRQVRTDSLDLRLGPLEGDLHVRAPEEFRADLARAARGRREDPLDARHAEQGFLERAGGAGHHLGGGLFADVGDHLDSRERHGGKDRRGQPQGQKHARRREDGDQQEDRYRALVRKMDQPHG